MTGPITIRFVFLILETAPAFHLGLPEELFKSVVGTTFGVAPDGKRFLVETIPGIQGGQHMEVVVNWFDELRQRAPVSK